MPGTNRISVEVHQSSLGNSDIVMGLKLESLATIPGENPSREFAANDEEWIELYNRSDRELDLSGWEVDGAIRY
ncbi:MAG: lamin tail domain-containing protein, partial [Akkermansiaceae bacterium]|nr:lamin tail domain-containing protein [Akkermansiaceae bacterium]